MRYPALDGIRGAALVSMILYHAVWDLVYLFDIDMPWYQSQGGYFWQQSICWVFILLSGFCWPLGRHQIKRGLVVFGAGALVTGVTVLFMPEERILFGVLTLLGSCMLLMVPLEKLLARAAPWAGCLAGMALFLLFRDINDGYLGFEGLRLCRMPEGLYRNLLTAYLGFPAADFYSADYFSLFPWLFLFLPGISSIGLWKNRERWIGCFLQKRPCWNGWGGIRWEFTWRISRWFTGYCWACFG